MRHLRTLHKYIWHYKWYLLLGILFVSTSNIFRILQPKMIGAALDQLMDKMRFYGIARDMSNADLLISDISSSLVYFALIVLSLAIMMGIFMYFMRQTIIVMSRLVERDLRRDIFSHYEALHLGFFRKNNTGDLMARITEDVSKVRMYLGPAILYSINLSTLVIFAIGSMLSVNKMLTLYTLLPLPILSYSIYYVSSIINKKSEKIQTKLAELNSYAQETYSGIRVIKSYGKNLLFADGFRQKCDEYKDDSLDLAQVNALFFPLMILLIGISTFLAVYVGGIFVERGAISTGNIAEFVIYVNMLTWPVTAVGWVASIIQQAEASQKRINEFLLTDSEIVNPVQREKDIAGSITFESVDFIYPDTGIQALTQVSFQVQPGEKILILGKTASGKTTIADMLLRMFDVSAGKIVIDGEDIRQLDIDHLRQRIGYVPQDNFLFSDTIANNIAFGYPDATREEIIQMAKHTSVHDDIMSLTEGYETVVGERGVTLSGGQKQRICIARTLIKNPDIVIIDDSLSAVDSETEKEIVGYLNTALKEKTAIIITHRLHGSMVYDKVLVLDEGRIIESGTHDDLMATESYYKEIYEQQLYADDASAV